MLPKLPAASSLFLVFWLTCELAGVNEAMFGTQPETLGAPAEDVSRISHITSVMSPLSLMSPKHNLDKARDKAQSEHDKLKRQIEHVEAAVEMQKQLTTNVHDADIELKDCATSCVAQQIQDELRRHEGGSDSTTPISLVLESIHRHSKIYSGLPHPATEVGVKKDAYLKDKSLVFNSTDLERWTRMGRVSNCEQVFTSLAFLSAL